jgi:predicted aspartyl protease
MTARALSGTSPPATLAAVKRVACLLALALAAPAAAEKDLEVPFEINRGREAILLRAELNGEPAVLILDTGASRTVVSPERAGLSALDLQKARFSANGPGMAAEAMWGRTTLRLGGKVWSDRPVVVMNMAEVSRMYGRKVDGLLGQDLLRECRRVSIDFKEQRLLITF